MTAGAFADAFEYSKNESQAHLFIGVLYRPIKKDWFYYTNSKKYNIEPYKSALEVEEFTKQLPLALLFGARGFFFDLQQSFLNVIQKRIAQKSKQLSQSQKQTGSTEIGGGVLNSMQSLVETTSKLIELQKSQYQKLCGI